MSVVHNATLSPTKQQVAQQWLSTTSWFTGDHQEATTQSRVSYRFDDPAGEVGVESVLISHGDDTFQLPMTYRADRLDEAEEWLLTTMKHSVLGDRWVYFGLADPVMVNAMIHAIRTGQSQEDYQLAGGTTSEPSPVSVRGTGNEKSSEPVQITGFELNGSTTVAHTTGGDLVLPHVLGPMGLGGRDGLIGQWPGGPADVVFAVLGFRRDS